MQTLRKSEQRGSADHGWLRTQHSFSFANYWNPKWLGFRSLRVINEDFIDGQRGFPMHPHANMEIISYIVSGALRHANSMGHEATVQPGQVQRISAGTGIMHSEVNPQAERTHMLQIWIEPDRAGHEPHYTDRDFSDVPAANRWRMLVSPDGRDGTIAINQQAFLFDTRLAAGNSLNHSLESGRHAWLQVISGRVKANGELLGSGDALAVSDSEAVEVSAEEDAHILLFDLN